jgi:hypothetical protein
MVSVTFEGEHYIDEMLKKLRTSKIAVLGDMTDDCYRGATCLCERHKIKATTTELREAARNGINVTAISELDGIKHKKVRSNASCLFHNDGEIWLCKEEQILPTYSIGASIKAISAHLDLRRALFAGGVKNPTTTPGKRSGCLQEKRALTDSWIATNECDAARYEPTAEDAIKFSNAGRCARNIVRLHFRDRLCAATTSRGGNICGQFECPMSGSRGDIRRFGEAL